jgi:hypothetical protein
MTEIPAGPILDYASPNSRTPLRLATRSVISILSTANEVIITESLDGHLSALAAILFTGSTVALLGTGVIGETLHLHNWSDLSDAALVLVLYFVYAAGTLALIVAVIHTNWRRTILQVSHECAVLIFKSPLKETVHKWPTENVRHVHVVQELDQRSQRIVFYLRIEVRDRPVAQLFSGHKIDELSEIARLIHEKLPTQE